MGWNGFTFGVTPALPGSHALCILTQLGGCGLQSEQNEFTFFFPP